VLFRGRNKTDKNALPITHILAGYINRNNCQINILAKDYEAIAALKEADYDRLAAYFRFFKDTFGYISHNNLYATAGFITALGKIYYNSVGVELTREEMALRCQNLMMRYSSQIQVYRNGSFEMQRDLYVFLLHKLSGRKPLFNLFEVKANANGKTKTDA
jgi:hypothetical protein